MAGKKNHTKDEIVSLAIRQIKETGYKSISLRRLLGDLHLTTGSFYKHFDNKNDLFTTISITLSSQLSQHARQFVLDAKPSTPLASLIVLGEFMITQFQEQSNLTEFLFYNPSVLAVYQSDQKDQFPLLNDVQALIQNIKVTYHITDSVDNLFIKVWSFIQGYGILIQNGAAKYDHKLLTNAATELIGVEHP